jgi:hypothetical protein
MKPEQARARARKIFEAQKQGQVIKLNKDGTLVPATGLGSHGGLGGYGKKTVLYDRKGEFARDFFDSFDGYDEFDFERDSPEFRMGPVHDIEHRHQVEREKLASAWSAIEIDPPWYGIITAIGGAPEPIPGGAIRDFQIVVPPRYPNAEPRAYPLGWSATGPHVYEDGHLCLWHWNDWSPRHTLAYAVAKTYVWIYKHEEYVRSGWWPGNQQEH